MANILRTIRFRSILLPSTSILLARYIAPAGNSISMIRQKNQGPETPNALSTSTYKTVPNLLCGLRIAASPVIGWLVINEMYWPACLLFTATGLTDLLDGLIARHFPSQRSLFGSIIDPVADKILISTLFVTLTYMQFIPVIVTVIVLCRDFCLLTGGLIVRYRMLEPPITFRRFFDPTISSIRIMPSKISKLNTILQMVLVSASLASTVFNFAEHPALTALQVLTVSTTVYSGIQYAFRSGILRENMRKRRNS